ncbi:GbcA glycine betaine demethylase subunit A [Vibrio sp. JCM 18904]|nr:GbcA glycine betaine demethylase subunit A [Vibrio sp. JCM 18904]
MSNVNQTIIPVELVDNVLNPISEATGMPNQPTPAKSILLLSVIRCLVTLGMYWFCIRPA